MEGHKRNGLSCERFVWKAMMDVATSKLFLCVGQQGRRPRSTRVRNGIVFFEREGLRGYRVNPLDLAGTIQYKPTKRVVHLKQ